MPLVTALIAGRADDSNRGRYMGLFSLVFSLAFVIAPAGGTAIYDRFGADAVWYVCCGSLRPLCRRLLRPPPLLGEALETRGGQTYLAPASFTCSSGRRP